MEQDLNVLTNATRIYQEVKDGRLIILSLSVYNRNLRLQVNGVDSDNRSNFKFMFKLSVTQLNMRMIINTLKELPKKEVGYKKEFKLYGAKFSEDGVRDVNDKTLSGRVVLRKINHNVMGEVNVLQIVTPVDVKYSFVLKPSQYLEVTTNDKKDTTIDSNEFTLAYADLLKSTIDYFPEVIDKKVEYTPKP